MTNTTTELVPGYVDVTRLALASPLARYREPTVSAYKQDLKTFLAWCERYEREVLRVIAASSSCACATWRHVGRRPRRWPARFGTVAGFYRYAVIDGVLAANPAEAVTRPKVTWEGQRRTVLHPLEFAAVRAAARASVLRSRYHPADQPHGLCRTFCTTGLSAGKMCWCRITAS